MAMKDSSARIEPACPPLIPRLRSTSRMVSSSSCTTEDNRPANFRFTGKD